ncbi:MAG: glycosyltransferase family 2 protein [Planctomycetaceae bacterium]|nr:glycosyltransferase family 2 protein [Planctomycetaceae bacterium]
MPSISHPPSRLTPLSDLTENRLPAVSVVSPVFNEADGIAVFVNTVRDVLSNGVFAGELHRHWEIILVDDGSTDNTWNVLKQLHAEDARVKIVRFSRNFGVQMATSAGLRYASGHAVITMDSDLQHPPELIPQMVQLWKSGIDYVYTVRKYDKQTGTVKRFLSAAFRKILNSLSEVSMPEGLCDYRLLDRKIVDTVNSMNEQSRFLRAMVSSLGFRQQSLEFETNRRFAGTTKFSLSKLIKLSMDSITSFSAMPLRWITYTGLSVAVFSIFYGLYIVADTVFRGIDTPGFPTLIAAISFLGGMQLIALGILGEYVGRIYLETKHRPLFVVQEENGFDVHQPALTSATSAAAKETGKAA